MSAHSECFWLLTKVVRLPNKGFCLFLQKTGKLFATSPEVLQVFCWHSLPMVLEIFCFVSTPQVFLWDFFAFAWFLVVGELRSGLHVAFSLRRWQGEPDLDVEAEPLGWARRRESNKAVC